MKMILGNYRYDEELNFYMKEYRNIYKDCIIPINDGFNPKLYKNIVATVHETNIVNEQAYKCLHSIITFDKDGYIDNIEYKSGQIKRYHRDPETHAILMTTIDFEGETYVKERYYHLKNNIVNVVLDQEGINKTYMFDGNNRVIQLTPDYRKDVINISYNTNDEVIGIMVNNRIYNNCNNQDFMVENDNYFQCNNAMAIMQSMIYDTHFQTADIYCKTKDPIYSVVSQEENFAVIYNKSNSQSLEVISSEQPVERTLTFNVDLRIVKDSTNLRTLEYDYCEKE